jgi:signal peptide peptidase SppA
MAVEHLRENQCAGLTGVAMRVFNQPLAIAGDKLDIIVRNVVLPRLGGDVDAALVVDQDKSDRKPYSVTPEGVALIDVSGTLVRKSFGMRPWSGMTSYEWLSRELATALADPDVRGLLLCCDSPGGEVAGLYDVVDEFYAARGQKPIFASICEQACSAAYAVASAADKIYITRTGAAGSVGIVMCHADQSDYDKKQGFKYEYMYFGEHKIDGNPHQPLSDSARASAMAEGRRCYGMLTQSVARNRGMTLKAVKATEAGVFFAEQAISAGLVDEMGTTDVAYAALVGEIARQAAGGTANFEGESQRAAELAMAQVSEAGASAPSSTKGDTMTRPKVAGATTSPASGKTNDDDEPKGAKRGKGAPAADDDDDDDDAIDASADGADDDDDDDAGKDGGKDDDGAGKGKGKGKGGKGRGGKKGGHAEASALATAAAAPVQTGMAMAAEIADLCILAGMPGMTAQFIKAGLTPQQAREKLMAARAGGDQTEIDQAINANTGTQIHVPAAETGVVKKCKAMAARMNAQRGRA